MLQDIERREMRDWTWRPGSKRSGFLPVYGGGAELPMTLICGNHPGPAALISGGVHSSEYVGIQAVIELAAELTPDQISGSIVLLPLMNPSGYEHRTMSLVFEDGKNLNRVFPGCPNGTLAERIAYTVTEYFFKRADAYIDLHSSDSYEEVSPYLCFQGGADAYIDLHSGDGYEEMTPYVYCQGAAEPAVAQKSRAMAEQVDVLYLVPSQTTTGGAYNQAGTMGVPGILIERGGLGIWSREEVDADKKDVRNVLRHLGILSGTVESQAQKPAELGQVIYAESQYTGCWYPRRKAGERVWKGEIIGEVRDFFGNTLQVCTADLDGVLLYQTKSLSIVHHGPMAAYGEIHIG